MWANNVPFFWKCMMIGSFRGYRIKRRRKENRRLSDFRWLLLWDQGRCFLCKKGVWRTSQQQLSSCWARILGQAYFLLCAPKRLEWVLNFMLFIFKFWSWSLVGLRVRSLKGWVSPSHNGGLAGSQCIPKASSVSGFQDWRLSAYSPRCFHLDWPLRGDLRMCAVLVIAERLLLNMAQRIQTCTDDEKQIWSSSSGSVAVLNTSISLPNFTMLANCEG